MTKEPLAGPWLIYFEKFKNIQKSLFLWEWARKFIEKLEILSSKLKRLEKKRQGTLEEKLSQALLTN